MPKPSDPNKHAYMFTDDIKFLQKAIIYHPVDQLKFLSLTRNTKTRFGEEDFPGGNVLFGQLHSDSLLEEIVEETGLVFDINNLKPIQVTTRFDEVEQSYYLLIIYEGKAETENVSLSHEHSNYKWSTKQEFLDSQTSDKLKQVVRDHIV